MLLHVGGEDDERLIDDGVWVLESLYYIQALVTDIWGKAITNSLAIEYTCF